MVIAGLIAGNCTGSGWKEYFPSIDTYMQAKMLRATHCVANLVKNTSVTHWVADMVKSPSVCSILRAANPFSK